MGDHLGGGGGRERAVLLNPVLSFGLLGGSVVRRRAAANLAYQIGVGGQRENGYLLMVWLARQEDGEAANHSPGFKVEVHGRKTGAAAVNRSSSCWMGEWVDERESGASI